MAPYVIVGCPIYDRAWIIPSYLAAIEAQDYPLSSLGFAFEAVEGDNGTLDALFAWHQRHPEVRCFDVAINREPTHYTHNEGERYWDPTRYAHMVALRNTLLDRVICHGPDRYFSLDSDILLQDSGTLTELVRLTEELDAVSPLLYMTPEGHGFPSVMTWATTVGDRAIRANPYPIGTLFQADIIMAAKMMSRPVFEQVRYGLHRQGEDLGWSIHAGQLGFKLWSASYLYADHCMHRAELERRATEGDPRRQAV